jgi:GntR family transcriptional regulator/MocR family aminotransferase
VLQPGIASSARALAAELGLARGTVEAAYSLLAAEGYVEARGQAGTVIAAGVRPAVQAAASKATASRPRTVAVPARHPLLPEEGQDEAKARALPDGHPGAGRLSAQDLGTPGRTGGAGYAAADMLYPSPAGLMALRTEMRATCNCHAVSIAGPNRSSSPRAIATAST